MENNLENSLSRYEIALSRERSIMNDDGDISILELPPEEYDQSKCNQDDTSYYLRKLKTVFF
ncbi:MAG: hypothetical protein RL557_92 [archaeon]|jgi:hypothetical protein